MPLTCCDLSNSDPNKPVPKNNTACQLEAGLPTLPPTPTALHTTVSIKLPELLLKVIIYTCNTNTHVHSVRMHVTIDSEPTRTPRMTLIKLVEFQYISSKTAEVCSFHKLAQSNQPTGRWLPTPLSRLRWRGHNTVRS